MFKKTGSEFSPSGTLFKKNEYRIWELQLWRSHYSQVRSYNFVDVSQKIQLKMNLFLDFETFFENF